jgi:hypothetical protein
MAAPASNYGTLSALDLLATNIQTIAAIGEDTAWDAIAEALAAHNDIIADMVADLVEVTVDRERVYGTAMQFGMDELDEFGTPDAQKGLPGVLVGFPLRLFGSALQWTRTYFLNVTGRELAGQVDGLMDGDALNVIRQVKLATYRPTNYTFKDRLVNPLLQIPLPVKALVNADGAGLPVGPNGETFDGATHNHYLGTAGGSFVESDLAAALAHLLEHTNRGTARINIAAAQEAVIGGFANFNRSGDMGVVYGANVTRGEGTVDPIRIYNRRIGYYKGAEVWVKPWAVPGYVHLYLMGAPRPLCWRNPSYAGDARPAPFELVFEDEEHPLRARAYERRFGIGTWNRTNGVVLDTAHGSYVAPTL